MLAMISFPRLELIKGCGGNREIEVGMALRDSRYGFPVIETRTRRDETRRDQRIILPIPEPQLLFRTPTFIFNTISKLVRYFNFKTISICGWYGFPDEQGCNCVCYE